MTKRITVGEQARDFSVIDMNGVTHRLENYRDRFLLLSFYRYAACPLCNLRVHELSQHRATFERMGLRSLLIFQSPAKSMRRHLERRPMPFPVVADPERRVYATYGLESSVAGFMVAMVHPRSVLALIKGFMPGKMEGDKLLLPADFIIGPDLTVRQAYYGRHIGDHMPLGTILATGSTEQELPPTKTHEMAL